MYLVLLAIVLQGAVPNPAPSRDSSAAHTLSPAARVDSARRDALRRRDSLRAEVRRLSASAPKREESPLSSGNPPFFGYTWVLYANILAGAAIGAIGFLLRQREAEPRVRRWWVVAGVIVGAIVGAFVFLPVVMLAGILSVGFSATPPALVFGVSLLGALFVLSWMATFRYHRR